MKVTFECTKCGSTMVLEQENNGNECSLQPRLRESKFLLSEIKIDKSSYDDIINDVDEVNTDLISVRFSCLNCHYNNYIVLKGFN